MADFEGLGRAVESQVASPPFETLRQRHRRRQQRRMTAGAMGVALVATVAAVSLRAGGGPGEQELDQLSAQLVAGERAPSQDFTFSVTDVEFTSPTTGYAIGLTCEDATCRVGVRRTADAGDTWAEEIVVAPAITRDDLGLQLPESGEARSLRFVDDRVGYAFNPSRYLTRDGGLSWQPEPAGAKLTGIHVKDGEPWFLSRPCPPARACAWQVAGPPVDPGVTGSDAQLRRPDARTAWLLAWSRPGIGTGGSVFVRTADGGRTWAPVTDPCPTAPRRQLSAPGSRVAWMVCADPKQVFRTADGGRTWQPAGTIAGPGVPSDLTALSADTAYLATVEGAQLLVTRDGGTTWAPAPGARSRYGFSNIQFLDERHGFAMGDRGDLWRTTDGTTWTRVPLPVG